MHAQATFLAGLQAGLISRTESLLAQSNQIAPSKRILFRVASCIGTSGMLLELIVILLSTLIVLSLTLDKLAAVASQSLHQDNVSDIQTHTLLFFQSQIADLKAFKPSSDPLSSSDSGRPTPSWQYLQEVFQHTSKDKSVSSLWL